MASVITLVLIMFAHFSVTSSIEIRPNETITSINFYEKAENKYFSQSIELTITPVSDKRLNFGYIPHWDAATQSLYVTNAGVSLIRYDTVTKRVYEGTFSDPNFKVDFFLPTTEGADYFVTSYGLDVYIVHWDGLDSNVTIVRKVARLFGQEQLTYVNTAKIDPCNRLLAATWRFDRCNPNGNSPDGSVFLIGGGKAEQIIDGARYPSGLEWDVCTSKMYYIDICKLNIKAYNWSPADGTVGKSSKIIYDFRDDFPITSAYSHYLPVGSNINSNGNLMVALFNESTVAEINPTTGKLVNTIKLPVETVTGAVYGGEHLDTLFVTTSIRKSDFYGQKQADSISPDSGKIFMIKGLKSSGFAGRSAANL